MPRIRIKDFYGIAPRYNRRDLPIGAAQEAINCRFDSGDLAPFPGFVTEAGSLLGTSGSDIGNLFWYRFGDLSRFIAFGSDFEMTAARSPVPEDTHRRYYWCIREEGARAISLADFENPTPNGLPTGSGASYRDFQGYRLGIPAPSNVPVLSGNDSLNSVGFGTNNTITSITRTNPVTVNTENAPGFEEGQRVRISIDPDLPLPDDDSGDGGVPPGSGGGNENPEIGQIWALDGLEGIIANVGPNSFDISGINTAPFDEFADEDIGALTVTRYTVDSDLESRAYVFTYVSQFDEEGPPSPASNIVDILEDGSVLLDIGDIEHDLDSHGGTRDYIDRIRIYRIAAGTTGAAYLLVGTLYFDGNPSPDSDVEWVSAPTTNNPSLAWSATISDSIPSISLGEPIPSSRWYPPPNDLWGILQLPNGIMAGWKNNTVYFSDSYLPHAWNPDNTLTLLDDVVGAESYGNVMVIGTVGRPYLVTGIDPSSMRDQRLEMHAPLINRRAIVDAGSGVMYVADNGLVWIGSGGPRYMTFERFKKEDWIGFVINHKQAVFLDRWMILYSPGLQPICFTVTGTGSVECSLLDIDISAATRRDNSLAMVLKQSLPGNTYRQVRLFSEDETNLPAYWKSGLLYSRTPLNFSTCQVFAENYPVTMTFKYINPTSYQSPVSGQPDLDVLSEKQYVVQGPEPFRMESGYLTREFEVVFETQYRIQEIVLSTSMDELKVTT